jgi:hypothetical protein
MERGHIIWVSGTAMLTTDSTSRRRTIQRILLETLFIGLAGMLLLGLVWEMGYPLLGWILAAIVWIVGDPILEIGRLGRNTTQPK